MRCRNTSPPIDLIARLTALEYAVAQLRLDVDRLQRSHRKHASDLPDALRTIARWRPGTIFSTADLLADAPHDPALAALVAGRSSRQLGKLLAKLVDRDDLVDGVTLRRVKFDHRGCWVWAIHFQQVSRHPPSSGA